MRGILYKIRFVQGPQKMNGGSGKTIDLVRTVRGFTVVILKTVICTCSLGVERGESGKLFFLKISGKWSES
jgi:hypothetical protein